MWLLDVSLIDDDDDGDGGQSSTKGAARPRFAWSQPPLPRPAPWSFPMVRACVGWICAAANPYYIKAMFAACGSRMETHTSLTCCLQGRTHTAHYVGGGMILCFGGGAGLSNRLGLLDTNEWTFGAPRLLRSSRGSDQGHRTPLVRPRLSHVAVCAGTKLMVHGGWNGRELGDLLALDLVPPISSLPVPAAAAAAAAAAASGRRGSEDEEDEEEEEEDESEDEEEDEEEGGHGSRRRSPQPRIECAQS